MFKFRKNVHEVKSPISGKIIPLSDVPDTVFAQKMVGDGIAIIPSDQTVYAPCDGEVAVVTNTKHAIGLILNHHIELLIHVGIDTVELEGEGFTLLVEPSTHVKAGTPLLKFDEAFIKSKGYSLITPVLITNHNNFKKVIPGTSCDVEAVKDTCLTIEF